MFSLNPYNNFLKSMDLQDKRGNIFSSMMDSMAGFHIFSIYNVPFQSVSLLVIFLTALAITECYFSLKISE